MYEKLGGRGPSTKKVEGAAAPPAPPVPASLAEGVQT